MKSMRPGGGGKFAALKSALADRPGVTDPGGLAAFIGRKKLGSAKMAKYSAAGRKRRAKVIAASVK
jgi:hypothetical protein